MLRTAQLPFSGLISNFLKLFLTPTTEPTKQNYNYIKRNSHTMKICSKNSKRKFQQCDHIPEEVTGCRLRGTGSAECTLAHC